MVHKDSVRYAVRYSVTAAILFALWLAVAFWVVPAIVQQAYNEQSLGFLNDMLSGRGEHPVEEYLEVWAGLARRATVGLVLACVLLFVPLFFRKQLWQRVVDLVNPSHGVPVSWLDLLLVALALGLATGLIEAFHTAIRGTVNPDPSWRYSSDVVWMAPAVMAVAFLIVGLVMLGFNRVAKIEFPLRLNLFVLCVFSAYVLTRSVRFGLRPDAAMILALGIAVQATRVLSVRVELLRTLARWGILVVAGGAAAFGVGLHAARFISERGARANLPPAESDAPNVLLLILDTVRSESMSLYGYGRATTPVLDRIGAEGVVFDQAITSAPWTLPAHASLMTGKWPHELSADWGTPLDDSFMTLAEALRARGYDTGGMVANLVYTTRRSGLQRGFTRYVDHPVSLAMMLQNTWLGRAMVEWVQGITDDHQLLARKWAPDVTREFIDWLDGLEGSRPFFAFLNYFDAHDPYLPPAPYDVMFSGEQPRYWLSQAGFSYTAEELQDLTDAYDGALAYLDAQLGVLFDRLRERGKLDNTLIIVTSDHGEQFGEHGPVWVNHGNSLYTQLLRVPLLIRFPPAAPHGIRVEHPVDLRSIPTTVIDLLGLESDSPFPGRSLTRYWIDIGEEAEREPPILAELSPRRSFRVFEPMKSVILGRMHYISRGEGEEELYDFVRDPAELSNLVDSADYVDSLRTLRDLLDSMVDDSSPRAASR